MLWLMCWFQGYVLAIECFLNALVSIAGDLWLNYLFRLFSLLGMPIQPKPTIISAINNCIIVFLLVTYLIVNAKFQNYLCLYNKITQSCILRFQLHKNILCSFWPFVVFVHTTAFGLSAVDVQHILICTCICLKWNWY